MARRDVVVGVRLTPEDVAKLDGLAAKTYRGRADILRCLISQAAVAEHLDILLEGAISAGVGVPNVQRLRRNTQVQ